MLKYLSLAASIPVLYVLQTLIQRHLRRSRTVREDGWWAIFFITYAALIAAQLAIFDLSNEWIGVIFFWTGGIAAIIAQAVRGKRLPTTS